MAYIPLGESFERLAQYMAAAGVPIPPNCRRIEIVWNVGCPAVVRFEAYPETIPGLPPPIEGATVETDEITPLGSPTVVHRRAEGEPGA